jgi:hypothetical protein
VFGVGGSGLRTHGFVLGRTDGTGAAETATCGLVEAAAAVESLGWADATKKRLKPSRTT